MLNGDVKGEEEKASLDGAGPAPYNCFRITADCNYSCCGGEEGERVGGWKKEQQGGEGETPTLAQCLCLWFTLGLAAWFVEISAAPHN